MKMFPARRRSDMGAAGPFPEGGLGDLLAKLQAAQADYEEQAAAIDAAVVEGRAGGGAVNGEDQRLARGRGGPHRPGDHRRVGPGAARGHGAGGLAGRSRPA